MHSGVYSNTRTPVNFTLTSRPVCNLCRIAIASLIFWQQKEKETHDQIELCTLGDYASSQYCLKKLEKGKICRRTASVCVYITPLLSAQFNTKLFNYIFCIKRLPGRKRIATCIINVWSSLLIHTKGKKIPSYSCHKDTIKTQLRSLQNFPPSEKNLQGASSGSTWGVCRRFRGTEGLFVCLV